LENRTCRICFKHVNLFAGISRLRRENFYPKESFREQKKEKKGWKKSTKVRKGREKAAIKRRERKIQVGAL